MTKKPSDVVDAIRAKYGLDLIRRRHHPDSHELDDWSIYGPKDPEIANLVDELAYGHGMRVAEIEALIKTALKDRIQKLEAKK